MESTLDTALLASMLKSKRGNRGLRAVSQEIGDVSTATLSRIEQGKIPDVTTFIRVCKWMDITTDTFIIGETPQNILSTQEQVVAHLRAERELTTETINMLIKMINMAYKTK